MPSFIYPNVRRAWLVLGNLSVQLDNPPAGYVCESMDLGSPVVRPVTSNRPDADGTVDRTAYWADRPVTINVHALAGAGAQIDTVPGLFAPFMVPSARPVLHYVLDRPGAPERTLTLRPANFGWPIVGNSERQIQLGFVAPDPALYDPTVRTVTAWSGSGLAGGRTYPLAPPRTYPPGQGAGTTGVIHSNGDLAVRPLLRFYGPITAPVATMAPPTGPPFTVGFLSTFTLAANQYADVDTTAKTAYLNGDPTQPVIAQLDWAHVVWPVLPTGVDNTLSLAGSSTSGVSQVQAIYQDRYLT